MNSESARQVRPAPRGWMRTMVAIGPGIVVTGSVIGSGELINTPVQAANFGFVLLWAVLISCLIKMFVQIEIGRHALAHRRTTFETLNIIPGPRVRGTSWVGLLYMAGVGLTTMTFPGMLRSIGGMMEMLWEFHPRFGAEAGWNWTNVDTWSMLVGLTVLAVLWRDSYEDLENLITVLVGGFSVSLLVGLFMLQQTEYRITWQQVTSGLTFSLGNRPEAATFAVVSLMGALGTAGNELFMYPYWVLEKGYAANVGPAGEQGWTERARGWIHVMQVDTIACTLLATVTTAAFFLMGSAVFYNRGPVPEGDYVIERLSMVFTESFGSWSRYLFLLGAFCTLYSTLVVAIAAAGRMWTDMCLSLNWIDRNNPTAVRRGHRVVVTIYIGMSILIATVLRIEPTRLIQFSHFVLGAFSTPLLMLAICYIAFKTDSRVRMGRLATVFLVLSVLAIVGCLATLGVVKLQEILG